MSDFWNDRLSRVALSLVAVVCAQSLARAEDAPATDQLLPAQTYVYITCPDVEALKSRFAESSFGKLWDDPSMKDFRDEVDKGFEKVKEQFQEMAGLPLLDVLQLPKGEISFAMSKADAGMPMPILLMDVGEEKSSLEAVLDKIDEGLEKENATKSTENVDGVELTVFTMPAPEGGNARGAGAGPRTVAYFVKDSFVVASLSTTLLKGVLSRWDEPGDDTFAEKSVYPEIISACRESDDEESDLYYFVDPISLVTAVMSANPQQSFQAAMVTSYLPRFGLDKLKGFGGAFSFSSEDFESIGRSMIYLDGPPTGLVKFFAMPAKSQSPPAWVAKDADQYTSLSWDPQGAYASLREIYGAVTGQPQGFDAAVDEISSHPANPGIHPRKDFFDQMTGDTHIVGRPAGEDETATDQVLVAIGIKDDVAMQSVIEKIAARESRLKKREFEGTTIYEADTPSADEDAPSPAVAVSRGNLFVATHVELLEESLRGGTSAGEPLSGSDEYQAVAKHFPSQTSMIGYGNSASQVKAIWNQLRSGALSSQVEDIDFTTLPEFSAVEKYFSAGGSYAVPHEKGAMIIQFSLPVE
jgi:hypothetical protein